MSTDSVPDAIPPLPRATAVNLVKNFVGILVSYVHPAFGQQDSIVSAVLVAIDDEWVLLTAGHCIKALRQILADTRLTALEAHLIDAPTNGNSSRHLIPFALRDAHMICLGDEESDDYGAIVLPALVPRTLAANGMDPIAETAWNNLPKSYEKFVMFGVPKQSVRVDRDSGGIRGVKFNYLLLDLNWLNQVPEGISTNDPPRSYAEVPGEFDIDGMSGGPVFGLNRSLDENDQVIWKYWLVGIQSSWLPSRRIAKICRTLKFCLALRDGSRAGQAS